MRNASEQGLGELAKELDALVGGGSKARLAVESPAVEMPVRAAEGVVLAPVAVPVVEMPTSDVAEVPAPMLDVTEPVMPVAATGYELPRMETTAEPVVEEQPIPEGDSSELEESDLDLPRFLRRSKKPAVEEVRDFNRDFNWLEVPTVPIMEETAMAETSARDLDDDDKLTESPPTSPEAVGSFADRVARARAIAGGAEKGVEVLLADLTRGKEASEFYAESRWEPAKMSGKEVEWSDQKIEDAKRLWLSVANNFEHTKEMKSAFVEIERQVREQEGYKAMREYAAGLTAEYGPLIKKTVKELTPGWFVTESALQKEMGGLQNFFEGLGELGKQEQEIEYWEKTMEEPIWNLLDDKKQKSQVEKLAILRENVAAYQNLGSLLERKEAPEELKNVISVALDGKNYDFGEGAIGDFRKRIYTDILKSLGFELGTGAFAVAEVEAAEEIVAQPMEIEERFDIEFGELDQQEAERIGADIGKGVESGMAGGRSPEVVAAVLKRKNAGREKIIAHGIRAVAVGIGEDRGMTVREKKQRLDYLHGIAESFFGASSVGSSILDAIINEIISLSAKKR